MLHQPWCEFTIVVLILLSSAMALLEVSRPNSTGALKVFLTISGFAISGVFLGELSLRCWTYRKRSRFFARYWLDIIASFRSPVVLQRCQSSGSCDSSGSCG